MSHGLTDIDTMFSVREVPWHGLGTVLDAPPSIDEALRASGLDWSATMEPAFTAAPFDADPVIEALKTGLLRALVGASIGCLLLGLVIGFFVGRRRRRGIG